MKKIFKFIIEWYLKTLTRIILWRHQPLIVAVAGSTNKTFIKDQILAEIKNKENVRGNPRSFNTEIGLPLAVLFLPSGYSSIFKWVDILLAGTYISVFKRNFPQILVLEMGVKEKGDIKYLLSIIKPKMVVISDISGNFSDNKNVMDEEMAWLVSAIPVDGKIILNQDHERVRNLEKYCRAPVIFYGQNQKANVRIKNIRKNSNGQTFEIEFNERNSHQETDLFGLHNVYSLTAARIVTAEIRKKIKTKTKNVEKKKN